MEPNFSGYVTKANLECTDGRTIMPGAFAHQDGITVPLVYNHVHDDVNQVLGNVRLSEKEDGVWGEVYLNDTPAGKNADIMVKNGDLNKFSIWAKDLVQRGMDVLKGNIKEASLVLSGANPGANVMNVMAHGGFDLDDDLVIMGFEIQHADSSDEKTEDKKEEDKDDPTVGEVLETLNDIQRKAVNAVLEDVVVQAVADSKSDDEIEHDDIKDNQEGSEMSRNAFEKQGSTDSATKELKHSDVEAILSHAKGPNGTGGDGAATSLRSLIRSEVGKELMHADTYGVDNLEILFPEARALMTQPTFVDRRQEWVKTFIAGTGKSPFSRVKTMHADITADEARALGYIKGNEKKEEVFPIFKRETGPAWIYKKQKMDRQDIIDVQSFDIVAWIKAEMRGKLDEEIARAGLFGDGRPAMIGGDLNPDKIPDPGAGNNSGNGIRAIVADNALYVSTYDVPMASIPGNDDYQRLIDEMTIQNEHYMGSGNTTAFLSFRTAAKLLTIRDQFGHRIYKTLADVASEMDVNSISRVPTALMPEGILAIKLDLGDYNFGTDRGGEVTLFDDFDIDFNQYKYLMETYLSGALTLPYSAQVFRTTVLIDVEITPDEPTFAGNVVTIPIQVGVIYKNGAGQTVAQGSTWTLAEEEEMVVTASPANGYVFADGADDEWTFLGV